MPKILPFPNPQRVPLQIVLHVRIETRTQPISLEDELRRISARYRQDVIKLLTDPTEGA